MPDEIPVEKKRKAGHPKKNQNCDKTPSENVENESQHADQESVAESESNCVASKYTSQSRHINLQKQSKDISGFYDKYARIALQNFPSSRLSLQ